MPFSWTDLPEELILCIIIALPDLRVRLTAATVSRQLLRLCTEPAVWQRVNFVLPARLTSVALATGLRHTHTLHVTGSCCRGRFCQARPSDAPMLACGGLSDAGLVKLLAQCEQLRVLDLSGMTHLTGRSLAHVISAFPQLEELTLRSCWQIASSTGWADGLPAEHRLRYLDLSHTEIDHLELLRLMLCTRHLSVLKLNFCEQLRESGLRHAVLPPSLATLHVVGCNFSGSFVRSLEEQVEGTVHSDDSLMREAIATTRRARQQQQAAQAMLAANAQRPTVQPTMGGAAGPSTSAAMAPTPSSPPPSGAGASSSTSGMSPRTPQRQSRQGVKRVRLSKEEQSMAQMNDVAEAADAGAWLNEMLFRYHEEQQASYISSFRR